MNTQALARKAVKASALLPGVFGRRRRGDVVILIYHRVGHGGGEIELAPETFERQLQVLSERERVLPMECAVSDAEGGVVVTFDDGYRDFYDVALPLLLRYRVPACLYLTTGLVHGQNGLDSPLPRLTWSQAQEAVSTGLVTVGAHTHRHRDLSRADESDAEDEMRRSKELIEDRLGVACRHFAYPFATGSPAAERVARRLFATAALYAWRTNRRGRIDGHRLGRTPVLASDGNLFFRAKTLGLLDGEALFYRALRRGPWRTWKAV